jgi:hypothetical protein
MGIRLFTTPSLCHSPFFCGAYPSLLVFPTSLGGEIPVQDVGTDKRDGLLPVSNW